jgi:hypothetical protein
LLERLYVQLRNFWFVTNIDFSLVLYFAFFFFFCSFILFYQTILSKIKTNFGQKEVPNINLFFFDFFLRYYHTNFSWYQVSPSSSCSAYHSQRGEKKKEEKRGRGEKWKEGKRKRGRGTGRGEEEAGRGEEDRGKEDQRIRG